MKVTCDNCHQDSYYDNAYEFFFDCGYCKICEKEYCIHCGDSETHISCKLDKDDYDKRVRK